MLPATPVHPEDTCTRHKDWGKSRHTKRRSFRVIPTYNAEGTPCMQEDVGEALAPFGVLHVRAACGLLHVLHPPSIMLSLVHYCSCDAIECSRRCVSGNEKSEIKQGRRVLFQ